jgi:hypothetical protein
MRAGRPAVAETHRVRRLVLFVSLGLHLSVEPRAPVADRLTLTLGDEGRLRDAPCPLQIRTVGMFRQKVCGWTASGSRCLVDGDRFGASIPIVHQLGAGLVNRHIRTGGKIRASSALPIRTRLQSWSDMLRQRSSSVAIGRERDLSRSLSFLQAAG